MCNPITTADPDRLLVRDTYLGYEYEVTVGNLGYRCGYVRVPSGHPWHGKPAEDIDLSARVYVDFSAPDADCGAPGADNAWWLGFFCGHAGDAPDPELPGYIPDWLSKINAEPAKALLDALTRQYDGCHVWTTREVAQQCKLIIDQAAYAAWRRFVARGLIGIAALSFALIAADSLMGFSPVPGFICSVLFFVLAFLGVRAGRRRVDAIVKNIMDSRIDEYPEAMYWTPCNDDDGRPHP